MDDTLRVPYGRFKIRIGVAIMPCASAGVAVTPGMLCGWKVALLTLAVLLSSARTGAGNRAQGNTADPNQRVHHPVYDPASGRYRFDHPLIVAFVTGARCPAAIALFVMRAWRNSMR